MSDEEDLSALPLTDRAVHKQWKVRQQAYEDMKKQFSVSGSETDGCFRPFTDNPGLFKKIVMDSNVAAQEAGIAALVAFLEFGGPNGCTRIRSTVVSSLVEKALASNRAGTRQNATEALLWFIELDTPEPVLEEMVPLLSHRTPKVIVGALKALTEIMATFGAKTVSPKPFIKSFDKLFAHADKNVRAETSALAIELYKWLGDPFATQVLAELKPVQVKELQEQFATVKGQEVHQKRYLKSQQEAIERQQASGIGSAAGAGRGGGSANGSNDGAYDPEDDDPMDFIEAVDVLAKVPLDLTEKLSSTKWKDRKEVLDELYSVVNKPKIANGDFGEIVRLLAKCMKDANVQVVIVAANCVSSLAQGLRDGFSRYQGSILSPILERTKEKKASVSDALAGALDAIFKSSGSIVSHIVEPTVEYLKHITPQVRIETAKFITRCLSTTKLAPKGPELKLIAESGVHLLGDTQAPVRQAAADILGVLMKIFGDRPLLPYLEGVDDIKKANIQKSSEAATVVAKPEKSAPKAAPHHAPTTATTPAAKPRPRTQRPGGVAGVNKSLAPESSIAKSAVTPGRTIPGLGPNSQVVSRKRLASPLKTPQQREISRDGPGSTAAAGAGGANANASSSLPPPPRFGLANKSLAGRSLVPPGQAARQASANSAESAAKISSLEKELEQLRAEKTEWSQEREKTLWSRQDNEGERTRLQQEISALQLKNAHLVEEHTRDILAIKSKETQLVRAMSDVDTARVRIGQLEAEVERLQIRLDQAQSQPEEEYTRPARSGGTHLRSLSTASRASASASASAMASPKSPVGSLQFGLDARSSQPRNRASIRRSIDFSVAAMAPGERSSIYGNSLVSRHAPFVEDKENYGIKDDQSSSSRSVSNSSGQNAIDARDGDGDSEMGEVAPVMTSVPAPAQLGAHQSFAGSAIASATGSGSVPSMKTSAESWRRAAEVTSQLRARIEAMKARQRTVQG